MDVSKPLERVHGEGAVSMANRLRNKFFGKSSYASVRMRDIRRLCCLINIELMLHDLEGGMSMMISSVDMKLGDDGSMKAAFLRVCGPYFDDREAVSFNSDGFIGLAGWADELNSRPFLIAFEDWVSGLQSEHREPGR